MEAELQRLSPRSGLADAIRYVLARWGTRCRCLKDVFERMTNGQPASRLDHLLPWNRKPSA